MLLVVKGLGKDFDGSRAVGEIDLELEAGQVLGLLGPNGAGKTTTISMIAGVVRPTRGTAVIAGHDIRTETFAAQQQIGLVPQDLAIYEQLTARQNLRFFAALYGVDRAEVAESVAWALELAGLGDRADRPVRTFSGGMKRRLNLVAGLVHRPKMVVLDEPTVGVDPQSRNFLFEAITRLAEDEGMGIVYTSHYMEEVEALCQRVAVIDHGDVIASDTVAGLLAAHAEQTVSIAFRDDEQAASAALAGCDGIHVEPGKVTAPASRELADLIAVIEKAGGRIKSVDTSRASLETVFLHLTGRSLRDEQ